MASRGATASRPRSRSRRRSAEATSRTSPGPSRPRPFAFPADHGPHPEFRTEWWYYTGNLETLTGRHVGFQLTFFRIALGPPEPILSVPRASAWAASQLYLAHFALTDTEGRRFHAWSRMSREALGLAGARAHPFRVWLDDWSAASEAGGLPVRLRAAEGDVAIDLVLGSDKPVVLQGDRGLSQKGPEPGNASYYYSLTRMPARGTVRVGGTSLDVSGLAWMDREWSTSALGRDLAGWDWMALQLEDGRDVMLYQLRRRDGTADPFSAGTLIAGDGRSKPLGPGDVAIEVLDHWTSPRTGVRYPSRWRVAIPGAGLHLLDRAAPRRPGAQGGHALLGRRSARRGHGWRALGRRPRLRRAGRLRRVNARRRRRHQADPAWRQIGMRPAGRLPVSRSTRAARTART